MIKWDLNLEGTICPRCNGKGMIKISEDSHNSEGIIPCPQRYFNGHGIPTCGKDGKLYFSKYDKENWKDN